ncbi:MAG: hypothetical protein ACKV19_05800, partial [Verrucomicrobiales bacterium]
RFDMASDRSESNARVSMAVLARHSQSSPDFFMLFSPVQKSAVVGCFARPFPLFTAAQNE